MQKDIIQNSDDLPKGKSNILKEDCIMSKKILSTIPSKEPNRYTYEVIREELHSDELGDYVTYGIQMSAENNVLKMISDVSTNREYVKELVQRCNSEQLDPIHIDDVVSDFIQEVAMI